MFAFVIFFVFLQLRIHVIFSCYMSNKQKITHPSWALKCKRKGAELRCIRGNYYLYEVTSKWNPDKKRSVKITGKLLGKITQEDGFVESEKARLKRQQLVINRVQVKEYGVYAIIEPLFGDTVKMLKKHFADCWQKNHLFGIWSPGIPLCTEKHVFSLFTQLSLRAIP